MRATRIRHARPFFLAAFAAGLFLALWNPRPALLLTVAAGICLGVALLGPEAAAAAYGLRLHRVASGHLRWPLCVLLATSTVMVLSWALDWSALQFWVALPTAVLGTVLGHDATLALLDLRARGKLDPPMVIAFPLLLGLAVAAGYSSLGLVVGSCRFITALAASL